METPPLQRVYTYSVRAFEGALGPRIARAVQRACNGWHDTKLVGLVEMPAELRLRVDLEFIFWKDGSIQINTDNGVLDLGGTGYATSKFWAWLTGQPLLSDLLTWAVGIILLGAVPLGSIAPSNLLLQETERVKTALQRRTKPTF